MRIPLAQPLSFRINSTALDGRTVNAFFETEGHTRWVVKRPGTLPLVLSPSISAGTGQGLFPFNSKLYAAVGNSLYEITIGSGSGVVPIASATKVLNKFVLNTVTLG